MAPTEIQYKALIIAEIGDNDQQLLARTIDGAWLLYDDYSTLPAVRYQLALRKCIELMMGSVRNDVTVRSDGETANNSDRIKHLQMMLENATMEITRLISQASRRVGGATGTITRTAPTMPPTTTSIDANDPAYRGDVYRTPGRLP